MKMPELESLARDHGVKNYSRMRKAELVALLQNDPPPGQNRASAAPTPAPDLLHHLHQLKLGNLQMIGNRRSLVHKKWIYSNNKK